MKLEILSFRDRFDIPLEKRPSGAAELRYRMLYGKSQLMISKQGILIFVAVIVFSVNACAGRLITPTVAEVSSENPFGQPRDADNTVNGSGLEGNGGAGSTHAGGNDGMVWTSQGNLGPQDYDPFITYDFGGLYDLDKMRIWNYNSTFMVGTRNISLIGPDEVDIYTSPDGINFKRAETLHFSLAPGTNGYKGQDIKVDYKGVRYIKFDIRTNHDGAVFDGTDRKGGTVDGRSLTGLSEVRFEGTRIDGPAKNPEPAHEADGVELNTGLVWRPGNGPHKKDITKYNLVVGIGNPAHGEILHKAALPMKSSGKTSYQLAGKLMQPGRKYWWRVDEIVSTDT